MSAGAIAGIVLGVIGFIVVMKLCGYAAMQLTGYLAYHHVTNSLRQVMVKLSLVHHPTNLTTKKALDTNKSGNMILSKRKIN